MRLKASEVDIIKSVISKYISDAKVVLFGSRVYDDKRGGDIDIFVETKENVDLKKQINILTELELNGIERKVDLVFETSLKKDKSFFKTIYKEGIFL